MPAEGSVQRADSDKTGNDSAANHRQVWEAKPGKSFSRVFRTMAVSLALAVTAPVLLAEDEDHESGKGNDLTGV
jgi:hypothetical protein